MRRRAGWAVLGLGLLVAGCGDGGKYARVSGVVSINGKAYPNAVVTFQPIATADNENPGRGSSGITDENGRFVLKTDDGNDGAVVGRHRVRIMTNFPSGTLAYDPNIGSPDDVVPAAKGKAQVDPIPSTWNAMSTVEFEVPKGGTDKADFNIENPKYKN
jgi:hypothetical protein